VTIHDLFSCPYQILLSFFLQVDVYSLDNSEETIMVQSSPVRPDEDQTKKSRKKLARREAKLLLKLEAAQRDVKKAEQKLARAQKQLSTSQEQVHELGEQLKQLQNQEPRDTPPASSNGAGDSEQAQKMLVVATGPDEGESSEENNAIEEMHRSSPPPVEGRRDAGPDETPTQPEPISEPADDRMAEVSPEGISAATEEQQKPKIHNKPSTTDNVDVDQTEDVKSTDL
jgi:hypothetical protein